jgi:hypothetical protein
VSEERREEQSIVEFITANEVGEGRRELGEGLIKMFAKSEVSERGWERIGYLTIKKSEMSDRRDSIHINNSSQHKVSER